MTVHHATNGPPTVAVADDGTIHVWGPVIVLTGPTVPDYVQQTSNYGKGR